METIGIGILIVIVFVAGWGWGQWNAERYIRAERVLLEKYGRLNVSMPMDPDDAEKVMGLLKDFVGEVNKDKQIHGDR